MRKGGWYTIGRSACATCRECGADISWVTSKRTGKRYPASVRGVDSENALRAASLVWVMPNVPHRCPPPQPKPPTQAETFERLAREDLERLITPRPSKDHDIVLKRLAIYREIAAEGDPDF